MKRRKAVLFGTGTLSEVVSFYLAHDSGYDVVAYTSTSLDESVQNFLGKPVVAFDAVEKLYSPSDHDMFVAIGYTQMNALRARFIQMARSKGYKLLSYVCSKANTWLDLNIGENCFIFEANVIQPFVSIGEGTLLWSGNHIGHHSTIGANCFISSHVVISGHCHIGNNCFIGVNATISDGIRVAEGNLIGPAARIQKDTRANEAYFAERTLPHPKPSSRFFH